MKGHPYLYGLIFLMILFWSGNYIVAKVALREVPPLLLSGMRISLAGLLMLPINKLGGAGPRPALFSRDYVLLVVLGLFGVAINQLFFVVGLSSTTVAHAAIIVSMGPMVVLLIASAMKLEKLTGRKVTGMLLAIAGVTFLKVFQEDSSGAAHASWFGDLFVFLSTFAFALFTVFGKPVTRRYTSTTVNMFAYVSGAIALAPMTIWQISRFPLTRVSGTSWACAFYMALFPSIAAYLIFYYALTHISASRVASFSYLQPPFATVMAVFLLDEPLTVPVVTSGLAILLGVYITERG